MSQRITSITRSRFMQLWQEGADGTLAERWPKGKVAVTKAEKVEERQLKVMVALIQTDPTTFDKLVDSEDWNEVEFIRAEDGVVTVRAERKPHSTSQRR